MVEEEKDGVDLCIENLNRIPKDIESRIIVDEVSKQIAQELGKKLSL